MDQILLKAYADGIIDSLKEREGGDSHASVSVAEEMYDQDDTGADLLRFSVKFYWDITLPYGVDETLSVVTVLTLNIANSRVTIGYGNEWGYLTRQTVSEAADWLVQEARRPL